MSHRCLPRNGITLLVSVLSLNNPIQTIFSEPNYDHEFDHLLRGADVLSIAKKGPSIGEIPGLTPTQIDGLRYIR